MDPILDGLWKQVLDDWDDDAKHAKLVSFGQVENCLGEVAALYRTAAEPQGSPYRLSTQQAEDAKKRMNGIVMLAVMHLEAGRSEKGPPKNLRWVRLAAAIVFIVAVSASVYLLRS